VRIHTLADGDNNELHIGLKGTMSALYSKDLAQKTRRGHIGRVKAGFVFGGRCYGYDIVKGEPGVRTINAREAKIIRRIFAEYVAGVRPIDIIRRLNAEGIPSPRGKQWNESTISGSRSRGNGILLQALYVGLITYGRRPQPKNPKTGKKTGRASPEATWTIGENPALRIIDDATWKAAQDLRASRSYPHPRYHRRPRHLLSGLMKCGVCGESYIVKTRMRGKRGKVYFACSAHAHRRGCENHRLLQGPEAEQRVLAGLRRALLSPAAVELAVTAYRKERARLAAERARSRDTTERELADVRRQITNATAAIREGGHSRALLRDLAELEKRETALEAELPPPAEVDVVALHPQAARRYRQIVEELGAVLADKDHGARTARAFTLVRSLITTIKVIPTPARKPVGLEITGDLLALVDERGELRNGAASQAAPIAITV
jgi:hypothetical protein